jgi:hypothetical protein
MNQQGVPIIIAFRLAATAALVLAVATRADAHHGGGTFDNTKTIELKGKLTRIELIGRWENDVLIVDTVGFAPGVLSPPILNSEKLHIVEQFSLDTAKMEMTRRYTAEDPVYFKGQYSGSDVVQIADRPYKPGACKEQAFVDYSKTSANRN